MYFQKNPQITQSPPLLAVTLLKVIGWKDHRNPKNEQLKGQEFLGNMEKGGTSSDPKAESRASPQPGEVFNPNQRSCHHTNSPDTKAVDTTSAGGNSVRVVYPHLPAGTSSFPTPRRNDPLTTITHSVPAEAAPVLPCPTLPTNTGLQFRQGLALGPRALALVLSSRQSH